MVALWVLVSRLMSAIFQRYQTYWRLVVDSSESSFAGLRGEEIEEMVMDANENTRGL